jgi:hypothetical protein
MSKKDRPKFRRGDKIVPLVPQVKAINDALVVTPNDVLIVTGKPRFDRKLKDWVLCVKQGIKFLAGLFFNMTEAMQRCVSRRRKRQTEVRWAYAR